MKKYLKRNFINILSGPTGSRTPSPRVRSLSFPRILSGRPVNSGMDWIQLMAQGFQESALNQKAKSPYGAVGIMQVLPSTAKWLGVENYMQLEGNIRAGTKYLKQLMDGFAKNPDISRDNRFFSGAGQLQCGSRACKYVPKTGRKNGLRSQYLVWKCGEGGLEVWEYGDRHVRSKHHELYHGL